MESAKPVYTHEKLITIGNTNAMQNLYFAEYFTLQGSVREMWLHDCVPNALQYFADGLILSTKSAHCDYKKPLFVFDTVLCCMHIEDLGRVSAKLVFDFYDGKTRELKATGWQQVVFKDSNRKTCRMPEEFRIAAQAILWKAEQDEH